MAHTIDARASTPPNDLRDLLDKAERQMPSLSAAILEDFLVGLDRIDLLFDELAANAADVRSEYTRWEDMIERLQGRAAAVTKLARQCGGLPAMRAQHPPASGPWWHLDELAAARRRSWWRRTAIIAAIVFAVALVAVGLYRTFFAPSPETVLVVGSLSKVEQLAIEKRWPEALAEAEATLAVMPDEPDLLLWAGLLAEQLGQADKATAYFARARQVVPDALRYHLMLGMHYLQSDNAESAEKTALAAQVLNPDDPQAYFILGSAAELRNKPMEAVALFEKAAALADESNPQLAVLSKVRMGMLLQQMNILPDGTAAGTPSPTPVDASPTP
jgi:tetratricopeptide (TPR) repeat protein